MKFKTFVITFCTIIIISALMPGNAFAEKNLGPGKNKTTPPAGGSKSLAAGCTAPTSANFMQLNNVKALIFTGGDMFWDIFGTGDPRYEIPKGSGIHSMFLASLWLGGTDLSGQLRIAAQRYANSGQRDFWTGPLSTVDAEISPDECAAWDKHFIITRAEVLLHNAAYLAPEEFDGYTIPKSILDWPAHGDPAKGQAYFLAPFFDQNSDGFYDPFGGDYPYYDLSSDVFCDRGRDRVPKLFGDETFWYVFNDKGNVHTETGGTPIGLEVHAQEFAFATNDEINNMTFTNYIIINRSTFTLKDTYFGTNFDADVGCFSDDFVGCDVERGLGYTYNGDANDENGCNGGKGYLTPIPAVGVDFFEGPFMDTRKDSADADRPRGGCNPSINGLNFGDGIGDNERWGMRRFVFYCNPGVGGCAYPLDDPSTAVHYYNYLRGFWKDGTRMVYGGNGHISGCTSCEYANFMFPGAKNFPEQTDSCFWGVCTDPVPPVDALGYDIGCGLSPGDQNPWTEQQAGNTPNDRRFVHSAGPFTLAPGATNDITVGIVWAKSTSSDPFESVELIRLADDKAQSLFDNCFKILNGPDAPVLSCQELDKEILLYVSNPVSSNNYLEQYKERDPSLIPCVVPAGPYDNFYRFQGYQVYQLKDATVSVSDIGDINMARLVAQVDIKDNVGKLVNFIFNQEIGYDVPTLMVNGEDMGIRHSLKVTKDLFASEDPQLVNHKTYYFMAIAYSYNQFLCYDSANVNNPIYGGNPKPYLSGRKDGFGQSIESTPCIPHKPELENFGTEINSGYGDSPLITRIEGQGNGRLFLDLTQASVDEIVKNNFMANPVYQKAKSPVSVKIIDPLNVPAGNFAIYFSGVTGTSSWMLVKETGNTLAQNIRWQANFIDFKDISSVSSKVAGDRYISTSNNYINEWDGAIWLVTIPINGYAAWNKGNKELWVYNGSAWSLLEDAWHSEQPLKVPSEQIFTDLGISITVEQITDTAGDLVYPGPKVPIIQLPLNPCEPNSFVYSIADFQQSIDPNNGFLSATMTYADNNKQWLTGVADGDAADASNWIRSGVFCDPALLNFKDYGTNTPSACQPPPAPSVTLIPWDPEQAYENVLGGTWAPYALASKDTFGVGPLNYTQQIKLHLKDLMGVDLVLTADKSKWTRSVVIEMQEDPLFSEGSVNKFNIRSHASVDKEGKSVGGNTTDPNSSNYIDSTGMGWFPGYAVNVETGERLNIIFGENSFLVNGSDMLWNPTDQISSPLGQFCIDNPDFCTASLGVNIPFWAGGMHFIYIVGNDINGTGCGEGYDGGASIRQTLDGNPTDIVRYEVLKNILWAGMPLLKSGYVLTGPGLKGSADGDINLLNDESDLSNDVTVRLRVSRPYEKYGTGAVIYNPGPLVIGETYYVNNNRQKGSVKHNGIQYNEGEVFVAVNDSFSIATGTDPVSVVATVNAANPLYRFSLDEYATRKGVRSIAEDALQLINIVPNPYNAFSSYERSQLDNRVKIINLPQKCTISIYNVSGTLIRRFVRDDPTITSMDWDLKNSANVPIAGGVYLIHVNAPGLGERIIKWFGALRPVDLDAF